METPSSLEPESILEVRRWKETASRELERLGSEEFYRRTHAEFADMLQRMEEKRQARLALERKPAA
jgi:hypothetical protein